MLYSVTQSCLTLCDPSVHGILQARILEWVGISSSRGSSRPRDGTHIFGVSCIGAIQEANIMFRKITWGNLLIPKVNSLFSFITNSVMWPWASHLSSAGPQWDLVNICRELCDSIWKTVAFRWILPCSFNFILENTNNATAAAAVAAAAKSLQSCPTLCHPIDGSPPGSPVPGILQARVLEWVAIAFSEHNRCSS